MLMEHWGNIDELDGKIKSLDINTNQDLQLVCSDLPAWSEQAHEAMEYVEFLAAPELLGWEIDLLRTLRYVTGMEKVCSD